MATPSTLDRSPSDFSNASIISLGRSTHADVDDSSEATPLLGISVQSPQVERSQGITAIYCDIVSLLYHLLWYSFSCYVVIVITVHAAVQHCI